MAGIPMYYADPALSQLNTQRAQEGFKGIDAAVDIARQRARDEAAAQDPAVQAALRATFSPGTMDSSGVGNGAMPMGAPAAATLAATRTAAPQLGIGPTPLPPGPAGGPAGGLPGPSAPGGVGMPTILSRNGAPAAPAPQPDAPQQGMAPGGQLPPLTHPVDQAIAQHLDDHLADGGALTDFGHLSPEALTHLIRLAPYAAQQNMARIQAAGGQQREETKGGFKMAANVNTTTEKMLHDMAQIQIASGHDTVAMRKAAASNDFAKAAQFAQKSLSIGDAKLRSDQAQLGAYDVNAIAAMAVHPESPEYQNYLALRDQVKKGLADHEINQGNVDRYTKIRGGVGVQGSMGSPAVAPQGGKAGGAISFQGVSDEELHARLAKLRAPK